MNRDLIEEREKQKQRIEPPKMYHVVFLNDDFIPVDFVYELLFTDFRKTSEEVKSIVNEAMSNGSSIVGTYTKDIAETKAMISGQKAKEAGHPLQIQVRSQ